MELQSLGVLRLLPYQLSTFFWAASEQREKIIKIRSQDARACSRVRTPDSARCQGGWALLVPVGDPSFWPACQVGWRHFLLFYLICRHVSGFGKRAQLSCVPVLVSLPGPELLSLPGNPALDPRRHGLVLRFGVSALNESPPMINPTQPVRIPCGTVYNQNHYSS